MKIGTRFAPVLLCSGVGDLFSIFIGCLKRIFQKCSISFDLEDEARPIEIFLLICHPAVKMAALVEEATLEPLDMDLLCQGKDVQKMVDSSGTEFLARYGKTQVGLSAVPLSFSSYPWWSVSYYFSPDARCSESSMLAAVG